MSLTRSAAWVAGARALGLLAAVGFSVYAAHAFGGSRETDRAFNALIVPNALMVVMSTLLPPIFVSVRAAVEASRGAKEALAFSGSAVWASTAAAAVLAGAGVLTAPGLAAAVGADEAAIRWAFLLVLLTGTSSAMKGILNGSGWMVLPALDTLAMNLAAVGVLAWGAARWGPFALVAAALAGGAAKIVLMVPVYRAARGPLLHPALRDAARLLGPVALNAVLFTAGAALLRGYAARLPIEGAASHLAYAEKVFSAPHDLFIVSMGAVILPALAADAAAGRMEEVRRRLATGLRMATFLGVPAAAGLWLLAEPVTALLYQRGAFDAADTAGTAAAVRGFSVSLLFAGHLILIQAFYALGNTGPILQSGALQLLVLAAAGPFLARDHGQGGLTLAWSLGQGAAFLWLLRAVSARLGDPGVGSLGSGALRSLLSAGLMGAAVWAAAGWPVLARAALGALVYAGAARFVCAEEWASARKLWGRA